MLPAQLPGTILLFRDFGTTLVAPAGWIVRPRHQSSLFLSERAEFIPCAARTLRDASAQCPREDGSYSCWCLSALLAVRRAAL